MKLRIRLAEGSSAIYTSAVPYCLIMFLCLLLKVLPRQGISMIRVWIAIKVSVELLLGRISSKRLCTFGPTLGILIAIFNFKIACNVLEMNYRLIIGIAILWTC